MAAELVNGFMLRVNGNPTTVIETLDVAKREAQQYIDQGHDVSVQTTSGLVVEWYFDSAVKSWVLTEHVGRRSNR